MGGCWDSALRSSPLLPSLQPRSHWWTQRAALPTSLSLWSSPRGAGPTWPGQPLPLSPPWTLLWPCARSPGQRDVPQDHTGQRTMWAAAVVNPGFPCGTTQKGPTPASGHQSRSDTCSAWSLSLPGPLCASCSSFLQQAEPQALRGLPPLPSPPPPGPHLRIEKDIQKFHQPPHSQDRASPAGPPIRVQGPRA